jgi:hypothetical protein
MDTVPLRKKKIDKAFVDEKFKELPMVDSIVVDSETEDEALRILREDEQTSPQRAKSHESNANSLILSTESLYLEHTPIKQKSNEPSPIKEVFEYNEKMISNSGTPVASVDLKKEISFGAKYLDSYTNPFQNPQSQTAEISSKSVSTAHTNNNSTVVERNFIITKKEIEEFKWHLTDMSYKIMSLLIEDLKTKEKDFLPLNELLYFEQGKVYPKKEYLIFESQIPLIDQLHPSYEASLNQIKDLCREAIKSWNDDKQVYKLYLVYPKAKAWELIKIVLRSGVNKTISYKISLYNPCSFSSSEGPFNSLIVRVIEDLIKAGLANLGFRYKIIEKEPKQTEESSSALWESGIEVYRKLAKSYTRLSREEISRKHIYYMLLEKYFRAPHIL